MKADVAYDARMQTYLRAQIEFVRGRGCTLYDADGDSYLDMVAGIAVASIGHAHPALVEAVTTQVSQLVHVSNLYETRPQQQLAQRLALLTDGMSSFFCNSGAEALECAIKLARKWGGASRPRIVATEGGFHGRTMGALSATGQMSKRAPFEPLLPGFIHVPYDDVAALAEALDGTVAAVIVEPIQGEAGVVIPSASYLARVRELCDRAGALLVVDEVQTGVGRTGAWFASLGTGVKPDVMCLAKGLAGGLPIGACLARDRVADTLEPGDHATTFGGGPVQCAAALAVLDVIEREGLIERTTVAGNALRVGLGALFGAENVRGAGLLIGVTLPRPVAGDVVDAALYRGLLLNMTSSEVLRLCPPLVITDDEIDRGLTIIEEVWREIGTS
jgi:acetylornithine/N-succinyldiaminopimelate aminotransferase